MKFFGILASTAILLATMGSNEAAQAAEWGLSVGYNNPVGAKYGLNLAYFGQRYAIEFGVGSADASKDDDSADADLQGDVDVKILFANSGLIPYLEVGVGVGVGGSVGSGGSLGVGAGHPFAGGGFIYRWNTPYIYAGADYGFSSEHIFGVAGLGLRF